MTKFQVGDVVSIQGTVMAVIPNAENKEEKFYTVRFDKAVISHWMQHQLTLVKPRPFKAGELVKYVDRVTRQLLPATILAIYGEKAWVLNKNKSDMLIYLSDINRIDE